MKKSIPNEILLPEVARLIREGHTVTITVRGNSMNPFLVDRRDRVTLGDFTTEQLQPGVAVLARDLTERIVFHRIIRRNGNILILQGAVNLAQTQATDLGSVMRVMTAPSRQHQPNHAPSNTRTLYSYWWMKLNPARRWLLALFRRI